MKFNKKHTIRTFIIIALIVNVGLMAGIAMSVSADQKIESFNAVSNTTTAINVAAIQTDLVMQDNSENLLEDAKKERMVKVKQDEWLDTLESLGNRCVSNHFVYSNSNCKRTYSAALSSNKHVNCALYVSWALQEYGIVPSGTTFWLNSSINGKGSGTIKSSPYMSISYNVGSASSAGLQPGDIVGWSTHTCVYAGRDANGNMLWFSAGGGDVRSGNYGPKTKGYSNKNIKVLIRIDFDKLAEEALANGEDVE